MGATTTQGTGPGSADRPQRSIGKTEPLSISKLIGPRVSNAGSLILEGESGTRCISKVTFPALVGSMDEYIIILTGTTVGPTYVYSGLTINGNCWEFSVCGDSSSKVYWAVIKSGI